MYLPCPLLVDFGAGFAAAFVGLRGLDFFLELDDFRVVDGFA